MLLKEFQSLALDVRVLKEDMTEVEIQEGGEVINRSLTSIIESSPGDNRTYQDENFESYGYSDRSLEEETGQEPIEEDILVDDYILDSDEQEFDDEWKE